MSKNPHEQAREALTRLMNDTELFARRSMQAKGSIAARLYIHGENGMETLQMKSAKGALSKREFAALAKIACVAAGADASVFVSEAWLLNGIPGEPPDLPKETIQGRDAKEIIIETAGQLSAELIERARNPGLDCDEQLAVLQNRREVVMLMGESSDYGEQRIMPIQRSTDGKFLCCGSTQKLQGNRFRGEFANFVSQECRNASQRATAKEFLAKYGISFGNQPRQRSNREERGRGMQQGM